MVSLRDTYPYSVEWQRRDNFGIALFSKLPLGKPEILWLGEAEVPSVMAVVQAGPTLFGSWARTRCRPSARRMLASTASSSRRLPKRLPPWSGPVLLLGDLNLTPWSYHFQKLLRDTGLVDSARGFGIQTTWPAFLYPLRIPVDHCLVSPNLRVTSRRVGRNLGSDHLPLLIEFPVY